MVGIPAASSMAVSTALSFVGGVPAGNMAASTAVCFVGGVPAGSMTASTAVCFVGGGGYSCQQHGCWGKQSLVDVCLKAWLQTH